MRGRAAGCAPTGQGGLRLSRTDLRPQTFKVVGRYLGLQLGFETMDSPATSPIDLLIVGGGVNGAGIARDAAGRGLSVVLAEQDDLAGHTSSASSKLIHGGLRYLEHYEFRLVREALVEREVLLAAAPHIIHPLRFVLPPTRRRCPRA